jgi:hypothetical protein
MLFCVDNPVHVDYALIDETFDFVLVYKLIISLYSSNHIIFIIIYYIVNYLIILMLCFTA